MLTVMWQGLHMAIVEGLLWQYCHRSVGFAILLQMSLTFFWSLFLSRRDLVSPICLRLSMASRTNWKPAENNTYRESLVGMNPEKKNYIIHKISCLPFEQSLTSWTRWLLEAHSKISWFYCTLACYCILLCSNYNSVFWKGKTVLHFFSRCFCEIKVQATVLTLWFQPPASTTIRAKYIFIFILYWDIKYLNILNHFLPFQPIFQQIFTTLINFAFALLHSITVSLSILSSHAWNRAMTRHLLWAEISGAVLSAMRKFSSAFIHCGGLFSVFFS